jgi:hypothetical protein
MDFHHHLANFGPVTVVESVQDGLLALLRIDLQEVDVGDAILLDKLREGT